VRAYEIENDQLKAFRTVANINNSLFYCSTGIMRWLFFRMGMVGGVFATFVAVVSAVIAPISPKISEYTGVIVSRGFSISMMMMQFIITLVNLEGEMASVERLLEYQDLPLEGEFEKDNVKLKKSWPSSKQPIRVEHLNFRYRQELPLTLKDVNFTLNPKEHVGIVGRTGAGKSSITVAMYRLAEPDKGTKIFVDGVDILKLGLYQSRRAFTIIPQDPFLFSGTLRQNLCPYS